MTNSNIVTKGNGSMKTGTLRETVRPPCHYNPIKVFEKALPQIRTSRFNRSSEGSSGQGGRLATPSFRRAIFRRLTCQASRTLHDGWMKSLIHLVTGSLKTAQIFQPSQTGQTHLSSCCSVSKDRSSPTYDSASSLQSTLTFWVMLFFCTKPLSATYLST